MTQRLARGFRAVRADPKTAGMSGGALGVLLLWAIAAVAAPVLAADRAADDARSPVSGNVVVLEAEALTARAAREFPRRNCLAAIACMTLRDPVVTLKRGDARVHVRVASTPEIAGGTGKAGSITMAGRPRYDRTRGAFFVDAPQVVRIDLPDLPADLAAPAAALGEALLTEYLRGTPIHVLDDRDALSALARLALREVEVRDGRMLLRFGS